MIFSVKLPTEYICVKLKLLTQVKVLDKKNLGRKSICFSKIVILSDKICLQMEILDRNNNLGQESKFWSKSGMLVKNINFGKKSKF